ncbi:uncharacterized protein NPIL_672941 [Nephila pilipes]|uniref:Uncharacterized protein n=1 Tax=Nephila pilipes TaxID=299642 RepID=A0A8X6MLL7_NEPPI|nr:uncharacterized protein NPIL_672941 [Nephila pilipes]
MLTEVSGLELADSGKGKIPLLLGKLPCTKRAVLKSAAHIFDPVGFISPFVVRIKCLLQKLWTKGLGWDEEFPDELQQNRLQWCKEITLFSEFKIPRYYFPNMELNFDNVQLHVFVDANPACYGAVAYFSSWERLRRLTAWIQRFCRNARKVKDHDSGELSAEELEGAEIYWMKYIQEENYPEDIKALKTNKSIPKDSKIFKLSPFLSKNCLLLVKGRLQNVNLSSTLKHPIVLPSNHLLVKMIIYDAH